VWGCVSNSVATTPTNAPRKIKEVLRITPTTDRYQWEHRPCGAASILDQEFNAERKTVPADLIGFVGETLERDRPGGIRLVTEPRTSVRVITRIPVTPVTAFPHSHK